LTKSDRASEIVMRILKETDAEEEPLEIVGHFGEWARRTVGAMRTLLSKFGKESVQSFASRASSKDRLPRRRSAACF
jgi:hypothetical protein